MKIKPTKLAITLLALALSNTLLSFTEKAGSGKPVIFDNQSGSIVVPHGWVYSLDFPQSSFMTRESEERVKDYRRTVQIQRLKGSVSIDSYGSSQYLQRISKIIRDDAVRMEDFEVYEGDITRLADGSEGIVLYSSFKVNDKVMMNLHVVVSTNESHYLLTYTDLKSRFGESGTSSPEFDEAWNIVNSLSIANAHGGSVGVWTKWIIALFALFVGMMALGFLRRRETEVFSDSVSRDHDDEKPVNRAQNRDQSSSQRIHSGFSVSHEDYLIQSQSKRSVSALKNVFSKKKSAAQKSLDEDVDDDIEIDRFK